MLRVLLFSLRTALAILGLLFFKRTLLSNSVKNVIGIWWDYTESVYCFWQNGHLTILILPIHKHGRFPIFLSLLPFLSLMFYSFHCRGLSPPCLDLFLAFFFKAIVNGISFLISFSVDSLLAYRRATDFFTLILFLLLCWIC